MRSVIKAITPPIAWSFVRLIRDKCIRSAGPTEADGIYDLSHGEFHFDSQEIFKFIYNDYFVKEKYKFKSRDSKPFIIDGGANIGVGCRYWKFLYPDSEVIAFEPDEKNYALLEKNMSGIPGFKAEKKALWSRHGTLKFHAVGGVGGYAEKTDLYFDKETVVEVPAFRLRDLLNRKIDLLKLDIEGGEMEVLRDCKDLLKNVERIFVEHHSFLGEPQNLGEFFDILESAGFRLNIHTDLEARQPFVERIVYNHKDCWLNVFGYRN